MLAGKVPLTEDLDDYIGYDVKVRPRSTKLTSPDHLANHLRQYGDVTDSRVRVTGSTFRLLQKDRACTILQCEEVRVKPGDITELTTVAQVNDALDRGQFTVGEYTTRVLELDAERCARKKAGQQAIQKVQAQDTNKRRTSPWKVSWLSRAGVFLVECGQIAWHVDLKQSVITKVKR